MFDSGYLILQNSEFEIFKGTVKEKWKGVLAETWMIYIRDLSNVPVSRNSYKTVSKLYQSVSCSKIL